MVVEDFDLYDGMVEYGPERVAGQALRTESAHSATAAWHLLGAEWPVSGDATTRAGTALHRRLRHAANWDHKRRGRAGGWLQRKPVPAEAVVTVQCEDCPWGLDVQGWDERAAVAQKLAQRHADRRNHTVTAKENGR